MKRLLGILIVMLLVAATAQADPSDGWTVGVTSADGADHAVEVTLGHLKDNVEIGLALDWWTWQPDWGPSPDAIGIFLNLHIDEYIGITDTTLPDNPFEDWLHKLVGRPYIGLQGLIPTQGEQRTPKINWTVGTLIGLDKELKRTIAVEVRTGQGVAKDAETVFVIGPKLRF